MNELVVATAATSGRFGRRNPCSQAVATAGFEATIAIPSLNCRLSDFEVHSGGPTV